MKLIPAWRFEGEAYRAMYGASVGVTAKVHVEIMHSTRALRETFGGYAFWSAVRRAASNDVQKARERGGA
jgi:hypothetical protein